MDKIGIYIHIPFCAKKCDYCDFYSLENAQGLFESYTEAVEKSLELWAERLDRKADALYIGGGTPSMLGSGQIGRIVKRSRERFGLDGAEITLECNPSSVSEEFFEEVSEAGVNRISMGLQSANESERKALGRLSSPQQAEKAVLWANSAGIDNVSLDLMLGIPNQTMESIKSSVEFCKNAGVRHVSAYILKAEENTPLWSRRHTLPDDDEQAEHYLYACEVLEQNGYMQYEISNFSKDGFQSRHNLKYWNLQPYLGIGPAAHSFIDGKRFYYPRDINFFTDGGEPLQDSDGGGFFEYCMLRLRLAEGVSQSELLRRYGKGFSMNMIKKAGMLQKHSLLTFDGEALRLTRKGFLLSNSVIAELID